MNRQAQQSPETPRSMGRWASLVVVAGLVVGLGLLIWQGGVTVWSGLALLVAGVALAAWIVLDRADFQRRIVANATRQGLASVLITLVLILVVGALYAWAQGRVLAVDFTLPQTFTLSPATQDVLARLDRPVQLTGFYTSATLPQRDYDDAIFHLFEAQSDGLFRVAYADPTERPVLAERFGLQQDASAFLTFVDPETGEPDLRLIETVGTGSYQERNVANALLRLLAAGQFKVYFTTGHGEIDTADPTVDGMTLAYSGLAQSGINSATLDAADLAADGVPADATALFIAGARSRFTEEEVAALAAYVDGGGSLFVAAEAAISPDVTALDANDPLRAYLAERWGVTPEDDLVIDAANSFQAPTNVIPDTIIEHPISLRLVDGANAVFFGARSLTLTPYTDQPPALDVIGRAAVLLSSDNACGETDLATVQLQATFECGPADQPGPLALTVVAQNTETGARLVITGDADFLRNNPIGYSGNRLFYTDALGWLMAYFDEVEIDPVNDLTMLPVAVSDATLSLVFVGTVIVIPGVVLLAGVLVWRRRQRR